MNENIFSFEDIKTMVRPIAKKYGVQAIYLFGSYARGEADKNSDLDFLVFGGDDFKPTLVFALAEELRAVFNKNVDVYEIHEINQDSAFYQKVMKERRLLT